MKKTLFFILFSALSFALNVSAQELGLITLDEDAKVLPENSVLNSDKEDLTVNKIPEIKDIKNEDIQKEEVKKQTPLKLKEKISSKKEVKLQAKEDLKPAEEKAQETKTVDVNSMDVKSDETDSSKTEAAEVKPVETVPVDINSAQINTSEKEPAEAKSIEAETSELKPAEDEINLANEPKNAQDDTKNTIDETSNTSQAQEIQETKEAENEQTVSETKESAPETNEQIPQENKIINDENPAKTSKNLPNENTIIDLNKEICPEQAPETSIINPKKEPDNTNCNVELDEINLLPAIDENKKPCEEVKVNEELKEDNPSQEAIEEPSQLKSNEEEIKLKDDIKQKATDEIEAIKPANSLDEEVSENKEVPAVIENKKTNEIKEDSAKEASAPIWSEENKDEFVEAISSEADNKDDDELSSAKKTIETHIINSAIMF